MSDTLDKLIAIHQEGYDETFKWEASHYRYAKFNWALLAFNALAFIANVVLLVRNGPSVTNIMLPVVSLGAAAVMVWLIERGKSHLTWILIARADWERGLRHWQAVRIEVEETGMVPEWGLHPPASRIVDNS